MSENNAVNKTENTDIIEIIKSFEDGIVNSFIEKIKVSSQNIENCRRKIIAKKTEFAYEEERLRQEELAKIEAEKQLQKQEEEEVAAVVEQPVVETVVPEEKPVVVEPEAVVVEEKKPEKPANPFADIIVRTATQAERSRLVGNIVPMVQTGGVNRVNPVRTQERSPILTKTATLPPKDDFKKKPAAPERAKLPIRDDKKKLNKKARIQKGYEEGNVSVEYDESGEVRKIRSRKSIADKRRFVAPAAIVIDHAIINTENITIKTLSEKIGKTGSAILKKLFDLGTMKNINDSIDFDTAELIAADFGITLELQLTQTSEEKLFAFHDTDTVDESENLTVRPPIVTIMGHVDHGKTSVLDYIRKSHVADAEAGGITQHIGAYMITLNGQPITFLDTPGHAAFTSMRARGANVTDIVIIVVAADDGIMPQTVEAINHAKAAGVQIIVAINKMDKPTANPDRILQQLTEHDLLVEDWGGTVPAVRVSAKTGAGINTLLENILLTAEVMELKANPDRSAKGTVVEAKLDKGKGPVATILVQNGTLKISDFIVAGTAFGKIRAMFDDKGRAVTQATPSMPVSILGLQDVPNAGDQILVVNDEKLSKQVVEERKNREKIEKLKVKKITLEDVFSRIEEGKYKDLNIIIKADVQGSVEAVKASLIKLSNDEVKVNVIHGAVGAINESDVMLADTSDAIIIGFNIRPDTNAKILADRSGVEIKLYKIIYEVIDEVNKAISGLLAPKYHEVYYGRAEVRMIYKASGTGTIAGCYVKDGKIIRNSKVRLIRDGKDVYDGSLGSLKRFKDDVKEVATGFECGIVLDNFNDIKEGDIIEAYMMEEIK